MIIIPVNKSLSMLGRICAALPLLTFAFLPQITLAQLIDVSECVDITDKLARVECYDAQVNIQPESVSNNIDPAPSLEQTTKPAQPVQSTTSTQIQIAQPKTTPTKRALLANTLESDSKKEVEIEEQLDQIISLRKRGPGRWLITLESGQVWHQVNSKSFRLDEGMDIIIFPSPFGGSFRLKRDEMKGFIQVKRVE